MDQMFLIVWVVLAVILVIVEVASSGILAIWFAIGSAASAIVAWLYPGSYVTQLLTFIIVSTILTFFGSKAFNNKVNVRPSSQPVYSVLGKEAIVTKEIDNLKGTGQISINGDVWSAKSNNNQNIEENTKVRILEIDGVKAVVEIIN